MALEARKVIVKPIYLLPILASLLFGLGCAWILKPQQGPYVPELPPITPLPDTNMFGPIINATFFMVIVAIGATMFYFLLKKNSIKIIKAIILSVMTMASMLLSIVYLSTLLASISIYNLPLIIGLSILITILFDLAIFKYTKAQNIAVIGLGGAYGALFSFLLATYSPYSAVAILIFIAIYDIFAVYRGPVGKIAQNGLDQLSGLSYTFKDIQMGLGDLFFYTVLTCLMFFIFPSILPTIMAIIGICTGVIITFIILEKRSVFPGLPFPIAIGLAFGFITALLI